MSKLIQCDICKRVADAEYLNDPESDRWHIVTHQILNHKTMMDKPHVEHYCDRCFILYAYGQKLANEQYEKEIKGTDMDIYKEWKDRI